LLCKHAYSPKQGILIKTKGASQYSKTGHTCCHETNDAQTNKEERPLFCSGAPQTCCLKEWATNHKRSRLVSSFGVIVQIIVTYRKFVGLVGPLNQFMKKLLTFTLRVESPEPEMLVGDKCD
jgi:hypothetical protein